MYCDLLAKPPFANVLHRNGDFDEFAACRGKIGIESYVPVGLREILFVGLTNDCQNPFRDRSDIAYSHRSPQYHFVAENLLQNAERFGLVRGNGRLGFFRLRGQYFARFQIDVFGVFPSLVFAVDFS